MAISTDKETTAAIQRQHRAKDHRNVGRKCGSSVERDMQIDPKLFTNGLDYGRKHGVDNAWNEPNFVDEVKRVHPEIVVGGERSVSTSGGCTVTQSTLDWARKRVGG